ncbi:MAG: DUF3990 domain-containing protein [Mediterranea sp.]|jgi:hypothetical protein|nr:DUF3990 domain-containing protein [Mediterranea sp.]
MKLYHASPLIITQPDIYHSREHLDFGKGFYLTSIYEQARKYAMRFLLRQQEAYVNEYLLDDNLTSFNVKVYDNYNGEWLEYVGKCRKGMPDEGFDVVEGGIANDRVFNTIDLYFAGTMSKDDALGRLAFERPNHQLCILNQDVITKHLHFIRAEKIEKGDI